MRKEWLLAMCATAMMASCAKDKTVALDNGANDTPEEIILGAGQYLSAEVEQGQPMKAASRGIGSVGDLGTENKANNWNGETVYVYGIVSKLIGDEQPTITGDAQFAINGEAATAPAGTPGATVTSTLQWAKAEATADKHFYYDGNNLYDFYGCHVDDAAEATAMKIPTGTNLATNGFSVPVEINGTQDLMVAMPNKESDRTAVGVDPEVTTTDNLYSAWSSRRGVKPNLVFKHVLTRLTFKAKCGNATAYETGKEVYITSVQVKSVKNKGTLTIIPTDGNQQGFTASTVDTDVIDFSLMKAPSAPDTSKKLETFEKVEIEGTKDDDFAQIGVPMMLVPGTEYEIVISTEQDADGSGDIDANEKGSITQEITVADGFVAGKNYNVNITVYGLEEISIDATLTAWEDGGDITIDPDELPTPDVP